MKEIYENEAIRSNWNVNTLKRTIGILLCKQSDEALVNLTLPENANIYAKEYKLYLPDKKLLQKKLKEWLDEEQKNNL